MSEKPIRIAEKYFINCCDDLPISSIERHHSIKFHDFLRLRLKTKDLGWSACNRSLGILRRIFAHRNNIIGNLGGQTPFDGFSFSEPRTKAIRPPYSVDFVNERWLLPSSKLLKMRDASLRCAIYLMIGTGCRPSEILNLPTSCIHLDTVVPYIEIADREGRELNTGQSNRKLPLYGLALGAMIRQAQEFPSMFEAFHDREANLTTSIGQFMRENPELRETEKHTLYCFRHIAEDLAKDAELDLEMRMEIFGHAKARSEYGRGYSLEAKLEAFWKMFKPLNYGAISYD